MLHQVGNKMRQQIHNFSGELCKGMGKVTSRFVEEAVFGLSASDSVRLTATCHVLSEIRKRVNWHKRLSRNLADPALGSRIEDNVLRLGADRISEKTLLIVDLTDLQKKYAHKMQYLADVRDASEKTISKGYWMCDVVGCDVGSNEITPLVQELWSQNAPDFISENNQVLSLVERARKATGHRGILVYDRGGDRREFLVPWTRDSSCHYIIRQRGDRNLLYRGNPQSGLSLAESCKTPYGTTVIKEKGGKEQVFFIQFGFVPVRLPEYPDRALWLVVVKGFGRKPLMLLTTEPMRRNRKVIWWIVETYITRWRVEETIRFIKQSYDIEDIRVLTYDRLKNMSVLVMAASFFAAVWLGTTTRLNILAMHTMNAAKRLFGIPDFRYYAVVDGIKSIFRRIGKGPLHPRGHESPPTHLGRFGCNDLESIRVIIEAHS